MNPKADFYFNKGKWQEELQQLRMIVLDCGLTEELKWGCPCYTHEKRNIVLIHVFKEYLASLGVPPPELMPQQQPVRAAVWSPTNGKT